MRSGENGEADAADRGGPLEALVDAGREEEGAEERQHGRRQDDDAFGTCRSPAVPGERMDEAGDGDGGRGEEALVDRGHVRFGDSGDEYTDRRREGREAGDVGDAQAGCPVPGDEADGGEQECDTPVQGRVGRTGAEEVVLADRPDVQIDEHDGEDRDALGGRGEVAPAQERGDQEGGDRDGADDDAAPDDAEVEEGVDEEEDRRDGEERDADDEQRDLHARASPLSPVEEQGRGSGLAYRNRRCCRWCRRTRLPRLVPDPPDDGDPLVEAARCGDRCGVEPRGIRMSEVQPACRTHRARERGEAGWAVGRAEEVLIAARERDPSGVLAVVDVVGHGVPRGRCQFRVSAGRHPGHPYSRRCDGVRLS